MSVKECVPDPVAYSLVVEWVLYEENLANFFYTPLPDLQATFKPRWRNRASVLGSRPRNDWNTSIG